MSISLLHTPDGVRDIYGRELLEKEQVGKNLMTVLRRYGYKNIQTPTFEFFDVFSKDIGTVPSKDLYKFFDKEGNTLVLKPDFTPAIARCAAKYCMEEEVPLRFCYEGNSFVNTSELRFSVLRIPSNSRTGTSSCLKAREDELNHSLAVPKSHIWRINIWLNAGSLNHADDQHVKQYHKIMVLLIQTRELDGELFLIPIHIDKGTTLSQIL